MVLGLIRKIKLIHSESKPQPPIQNKITTGVSAACYIQLFSKTFSIYGNWTCFQFMEIELVFNLWKLNLFSISRKRTQFLIIVLWRSLGEMHSLARQVDSPCTCFVSMVTRVATFCEDVNITLLFCQLSCHYALLYLPSSIQHAWWLNIRI